MALLYATNLLTGRSWAATEPVYKPRGAGELGYAAGYYQFTATPAADDLVEFFRVPKGAYIIGGTLKLGKIESTTSGATFDMDMGWALNGSDASDTDGFGNFGAPSFAAVTGVKPEATFAMYRYGNLLGTAGFQTFVRETSIRGHIVASATNFATATAFAEAFYVVR